MNTWEQQGGETAKAYAAFCVYRDMGRDRSLLKAWRLQKGYEKATSVPGSWVNWSDSNDWKRRAESYDAHLEKIARAEREDEHRRELADYRERQRKQAEQAAGIATAALGLAGQELQSMVKNKQQIGKDLLPAYLRAAAAVLEQSRNAEAEALGVSVLMQDALNGDRSKETD